MSIDISGIAFAIRAASAASPQPIKLSQAQQCTAAALGYKSLAALQAAGDTGLPLGRNSHIVLDAFALMARSRALGLPHDEPALLCLVQAAFEAKSAPGVEYHHSLQELEDFLREKIESYLLNHVETAGQMAMANQDGIAEIYLPFDVDWTTLPAPSKDCAIAVPIEGHISMKIDEERPYSGHRINVEAKLSLTRVGQNLYEVTVRTESAKLDRGFDPEAEEEPEQVSLAEGLAEELGLSFSEAEH